MEREEGASDRKTDHKTDSLLRQEKLIEIKEFGVDHWKTIYLWCKNKDSFPLFYTNLAHTIGRKIRDSVTLSTKEIYGGSMLLEEIAKKSSLLLDIYEKQNSEHI